MTVGSNTECTDQSLCIILLQKCAKVSISHFIQSPIFYYTTSCKNYDIDTLQWPVVIMIMYCFEKDIEFAQHMYGLLMLPTEMDSHLGASSISIAKAIDYTGSRQEVSLTVHVPILLFMFNSVQLVINNIIIIIIMAFFVRRKQGVPAQELYYRVS